MISAITLPPLTDATGYLFPKVPQARIGLAKAVSGAPSVAADGSFSVSFVFNVRNFSREPLQGVTLTDPLAGASPLFGNTSGGGRAGAGSYRVSATGGSCGGRNAGFDGSGDQTLLSGLTLAGPWRAVVTMTLLVQPAVPLPPEVAPGVRYRNQGTVEGTGAWTGQSRRPTRSSRTPRPTARTPIRTATVRRTSLARTYPPR